MSENKILHPDIDYHFKEVDMSDDISTEITGLTERRIAQLCVEFQESEGKTGLKSKRFGRKKTSPWQIERSAAEEYERSSRGPKPETN